MLLTSFTKDIKKIDNDNKNFKRYKEEAMIVNELMGNMTAKYFHLPDSNIRIAEDKNGYGILYEEENKDLVTANTLMGNRTNLYNFIEYIYNKYHDKELVKDLFKVIVTDISMGNPCRFQNTLLFSQEDKLKLERVNGFAYSYLAYNDSRHPALDGVYFQEEHGELYTKVLEDLPKLLTYSPYLNTLLEKFKNLDMNKIKEMVETYYDVSVPSYLVDRILTHDKEIHNLIREKVR